MLFFIVDSICYIIVYMIFYQDMQIIKEKEHSCQPNYGKNEIAETVVSLKNEAASTDVPMPQLYKRHEAKLRDRGYDLIDSIPSFDNLKHSLYNARHKSAGVSRTTFTSVDEVDVPDQFLDFMLGCDTEKKILIFCTSLAREMINHIDDFFGDGTFKCSPHPYVQLYTLHGDIGSNNNITNVVPLIYALLLDKKKETYVTMLRIIKAQLPKWEPKKYHCDYETAAINAMLEVFPRVEIKGCYMHFSKNIWKKAKLLGHIKSKPEKRIVGMCSILPLIPPGIINEAWTYIKNEVKTLEFLKMGKFLKYINRVWLNKKIKRYITVFGERHRTNNVAESFHGDLNKAVNKNNVNLMRLLNALREKGNLSKGPMPKKRKVGNKRRAQYIMNDDYVRHVQLQLLEGHITIGHAIDKLR